jgi:hypothetical protein
MANNQDISTEEDVLNDLSLFDRARVDVDADVRKVKGSLTTEKLLYRSTGVELREMILSAER